eukprot:scpid66730/ scgid33893/ 
MAQKKKVTFSADVERLVFENMEPPSSAPNGKRSSAQANFSEVRQPMRLLPYKDPERVNVARVRISYSHSAERQTMSAPNTMNTGDQKTSKSKMNNKTASEQDVTEPSGFLGDFRSLGPVVVAVLVVAFVIAVILLSVAL